MQLAKHLGALVATTTSSSKVDFVRSASHPDVAP